MGIGGHMLGEVKLRRLSRLTGLPLKRAYIRGSYSEGVVWHTPEPYNDTHYMIDTKTGKSIVIVDPTHWSTCATHLEPSS